MKQGKPKNGCKSAAHNRELVSKAMASLLSEGKPILLKTIVSMTKLSHVTAAKHMKAIKVGK